MKLYDDCPKCGEPYDTDKYDLYICPRCGEEGSSACCNPGGNYTLCIDCNSLDVDGEE